MVKAHFHGGAHDGHECEAPMLPIEIRLTRNGKQVYYVLHHSDRDGVKHYYLRAANS